MTVSYKIHVNKINMFNLLLLVIPVATILLFKGSCMWPMNPDLNAQYTYWIFVSCSINLIETIILFWYLYIFKCNGLNTIIFFKLMLLNFFLGFNSWIIQQYQRHLTRQNSQNHIHHQYKERGWLPCVLVFCRVKISK